MYGGISFFLGAGEYEAYDGWATEPDSHVWPMFRYEANRWAEAGEAKIEADFISTTSLAANGFLELVRASDNKVITRVAVSGAGDYSEVWTPVSLRLGGYLVDGEDYTVRVVGDYPNVPKMRRVRLTIRSASGGNVAPSVAIPTAGDTIGEARSRMILGRYPIAVKPRADADSVLPGDALPGRARTVALLNASLVSSSSDGEIAPNLATTVNSDKLGGKTSVYLEAVGKASDADSVFHIELAYEDDSSRVRGASVSLSGESQGLYRSTAFLPENAREVIPWLYRVKGSGTAYISAIRLVVDSDGWEGNPILRTRGSEELLVEEVSATGTGNTTPVVRRNLYIPGGLSHEVYLESAIANTGTAGTSESKLTGNSNDLGSVTQAYPSPATPDLKEASGLKSTMDSADILIDSPSDPLVYRAGLVVNSDNANATAETTGARVLVDYHLDPISTTTTRTADWTLSVDDIDADSTAIWSLETTSDKNTSSDWAIESTQNKDTVGDWRLDNVNDSNTVATWEIDT